MKIICHLDLCSSCFPLILALVLIHRGASGSTFTFVNKCDYTVWPGILANAGSPALETTGFELPRSTLRSLQSPTGWSGRFWARTGCNFGPGSPVGCATGDCGSGRVTCDGNGAATPVTLAEVTLGSGGGRDFYDVSLVDGFNVPVVVEASGGSGGGSCGSTGCAADLNRRCPAELRVGEGEGCKSACGAFGTPEYCCSGAYGSPATCKASVYSKMFKLACPASYSYAYDDATSTFTCTGGDYIITFCPSTPSQKSSEDTAQTTAANTPNQPSQGLSGTGTLPGTNLGGVGSGSGMMGDGSWLAGLAMGGSARTLSLTALQSVATLVSFVLCSIHF